MATKNNPNVKARSKAAKTVLWILLGIAAAALLGMLVMVIIAAFGGTGTSTGSNFGEPYKIFRTVFLIFAACLVLAWLLTEPSFKKVEDKEEKHDLDYRTQYVKKAAQPRPTAQKVEEKSESTAESKEE